MFSPDVTIKENVIVTKPKKRANMMWYNSFEIHYCHTMLNNFIFHQKLNEKEIDSVIITKCFYLVYT